MKKSLFAAAPSVAAFGARNLMGRFERGLFRQLQVWECMPCHTRNMDLPFYASAPGIKQSILKLGMRHGRRR